jgi:hypothetical protein
MGAAMLEFITFLLAPIAYAGLTLAAVQSARGQLKPVLWRTVVIIIVTHVILVWTVRYEWQFSEATREGYAGFVLFHGALLAIITSLFVGAHTARNLILGAFAIVTLGAVGAVFKFDVVEKYRIPVIVSAIAGIIGLVQAFRARSARPAT